MSDAKQSAELEQPASTAESADELEQLQRDIQRQIRTNQRFLEGFLDENFSDEEE